MISLYMIYFMFYKELNPAVLINLDIYLYESR